MSYADIRDYIEGRDTYNNLPSDNQYQALNSLFVEEATESQLKYQRDLLVAPELQKKSKKVFWCRTLIVCTIIILVTIGVVFMMRHALEPSHESQYDCIILTGGNDIIDEHYEVYSPLQPDVASVLRARVVNRQSHVAVWFKNRIVTVAGSPSEGNGGAAHRRMIIYDPVTGIVSSGPYLPIKRERNPSGAVLNGILYVCGGWEDGTHDSKTCDKLEELDGSWKPAASMINRRAWFEMVSYGGYMYAIGGWHISINRHVERYDPRAIEDNWKNMSGLQRARYGYGAAALNGKIFVCGGQSYSSSNEEVISHECEVYDIATNVWTMGPNLLVKRTGLDLVAFHGQFVAIGGKNETQQHLTCEVLDFSNSEQIETWTLAKPRLHLSRYFFKAVVIPHEFCNSLPHQYD